MQTRFSFIFAGNQEDAVKIFYTLYLPVPDTAGTLVSTLAPTHMHPNPIDNKFAVDMEEVIIALGREDMDYHQAEAIDQDELEPCESKIDNIQHQVYSSL